MTPFLDMASQVAAKAAAPGLQLDSKDEVAATLQPFAQNTLFTYIRVKDKKGAQVFVHRRKGLADLPSDSASGEIDGELFVTAPIAVDAGELGTLTIGMSLAGRDATVVAARLTLIAIGVGAVVLMVAKHEAAPPLEARAAARGDRQ